jgi:vancomycin resistance protein YoaR
MEQEAIDRVADVSREVLIKTWETEVQMIRFAVEQTLNYRVQAIRASLDYMLAHLRVPELAIERAKVLADLKLKMYDSTAAYYNALVNKAQVELGYAKLAADAATDNNKIVATYSQGTLASRAEAAAAGAGALGQAAAAALSSLNTLAAITNSTEE